jgi:plasmid stabilization system protein ParE
MTLRHSAPRGATCAGDWKIDCMNLDDFEFHLLADEEVVEAFEWYLKRSRSAAQGFLDELHRTLERIAANPDGFAIYQHGVRACAMQRFPYLVVYRSTETHIEIVAVPHAHRRPGYWKRRLRKN